MCKAKHNLAILESWLFKVATFAVSVIKSIEKKNYSSQNENSSEEKWISVGILHAPLCIHCRRIAGSRASKRKKRLADVNRMQDIIAAERRQKNRRNSGKSTLYYSARASAHSNNKIVRAVEAKCGKIADFFCVLHLFLQQKTEERNRRVNTKQANQPFFCVVCPTFIISKRGCARHQVQIGNKSERLSTQDGTFLAKHHKVHVNSYNSCNSWNGLEVGNKWVNEQTNQAKQF